jgi:hypothetical protein
MRNDLFTPAVAELELAAIVQILSDIRDFMGCPPKAYFAIASSGLKITGRITNMELREGQQVDASVILKTASGNPAAYEKGSASWSSSDETVVSVEQVMADELKATIFGKNGSTNASALITFTCDGDPDAGPGQVRNIVGTLAVVCTQGEAVVAEIDTGVPTASGPQVTPLRDKLKKS